MNTFNAIELYSNLFWGSVCDKLIHISQDTNPTFLKNTNIKLWAIMKQIFAFNRQK